MFVCEGLPKSLPKKRDLLQFENNPLYLCMFMGVLTKYVLFYDICTFKCALT
jgi:hypothetical protein